MKINKVQTAVLVIAAAGLASLADGFQFSVQSMPVPALLSPFDQASEIAQHPQFSWTDDFVNGVDDPLDCYRIQLSTNSSFSAPVLDDTIKINRYVPLDALATGIYWWRVCAVRNGMDGAWSEVRGLTITAPANTYTIPSGASAAAIAETLSAAKDSGSAKVVFTPGTYNVAPAADSYLMDLTNASNLIIDGNGATVVIGTPDAGFARVTGCTNVTVQNFTVDYDPLPFTVGTVTAVDTTHATFDLKLWDGFPRLDDPQMITSDLQGTWGSLMDMNVPGRLKHNVGDVYFTTNTFPCVGTNTYRLTLLPASARWVGDFKTNDVFVKLARVRSLLFGDKSTGVTYDHVIAYASPGGYFVGAYCDGVNILNGGAEIKAGRWNSTCADGVHCQNFRTGPWVENCSFEGLMDDSANIYSVPMYIDRKLSDTAVRLYNRSIADLRTHDLLRIFDPGSGYPVGEGRIMSIVSTNVSGQLRYDVTLDSIIGSVVPGTAQTNTMVYDMSRTGNGFVFLDNRFSNSRRYGLYIKSAEGLIQGNVFDGLSGPAITMHNTLPEGLNTSDVSIISNTITGCSFSGYQLSQQHGSIELYNGTSEFKSSWRGQRRIQIQGNTIINWQRRAISGECATTLLIEDNIITNTDSSFISGGVNDAIFINNTDNAMILNNQIVDTRPMDEAIQVQNSTNTVVSGNVVP